MMARPFVFLLLTAVFIIPVLLLFLQSVSSPWRFGTLLPGDLNTGGWLHISGDPGLQHAIMVTVGLGAAVVALNLLIAVPAARFLAFREFRGKSVLDTILFMPILVPVIAIAMGLHLVFIRIGIADSFTGVLIVHLIPTVPYAIRIFRAGFERIGTKWEEQCRTLGSGRWQTFWHAELPRLAPSLRAAVFLTMVISLSQYVLTVIIGGGRVVTLPLLYYPYAAGGNDTITAAFSILFAAVPVTMVLVIEILLRTVLPYPLKRST
ncbi:ABC transporter permease subunit [Alteribacter natronophilus]|nr:ABC transporter permease subunit [Alteribacter natronophilus]